MRSSTINCLIILAGCAASTPVKRATILYENSEDRIPNKYTISLREGYTLEEHLQRTGTNLTELPHFYAFNSFHGYMADIADSNLLHDVIRMDPGVAQVDCHQLSARDLSPTNEQDPPDGYLPPFEDANNATVLDKRDSGWGKWTEYAAPWGLQMVGAGEKLHDITEGKRLLFESYDYQDGAGRGVDVYVLDTGIFLDHDYFQGRATNLNNADLGSMSPYVDEQWIDTAGHGTKMAGIIGSRYYGVAQYANLISVKVRGAGMSSDRTARAIEDVTKRHNDRVKRPQDGGFRGSVISMSFETDDTSALRSAIAAAKKAGITLVASAGNANSNNDIHKLYPCGYHQHVECVGAVNSQYFMSDSSNYGNDIGWLAPGVGIWSTKADKTNKDKTGLVIDTGTSQACAFVSGTFAIFTSWLGLANGQAANWAHREALFDQVEMNGRSGANRLISTGIKHTSRRPGEPFYGAGDQPAYALHTAPFPEVAGQPYPPNQAADPNSRPTSTSTCFAPTPKT